jgi:hypothetical protein
MRRSAIALIIPLALGLLVEPLATEAQQATKVHRIIGRLLEVGSPPHHGALRALMLSMGQNSPKKPASMGVSGQNDMGINGAAYLGMQRVRGTKTRRNL